MILKSELDEKLEHLAQRAIKQWGVDAQIDQAIEECSELVTILARRNRKRFNSDDVLEEMADVYIMLHELLILYDYTNQDLDKMIIKKLAKMEEKLNKNEY